MQSRQLLIAIVITVIATTIQYADDSKPKLAPEKAMAEATTRWNKAAEGVTAKSPIGVVGFKWEDDRFPHPTFKGGSAEGYGAFARVLVKFLDEKGNFEFLAENNLFNVPLRYGNAKVDWTFGKLISDFSQPKAFGDHDEATRKSLKAYADKIADLAKKGKP